MRLSHKQLRVLGPGLGVRGPDCSLPPGHPSGPRPPLWAPRLRVESMLVQRTGWRGSSPQCRLCTQHTPILHSPVEKGHPAEKRGPPGRCSLQRQPALRAVPRSQGMLFTLRYPPPPQAGPPSPSPNQLGLLQTGQAVGAPRCPWGWPWWGNRDSSLRSPPLRGAVELPASSPRA